MSVPASPPTHAARVLTSSTSFEGLGVHTGRHAHIIIEPAPTGTGLVFVRMDLTGHPRVPVSRASVHPEKCQRCTILSLNGIQIFTPEHLLSALMGLGIRDAFLLLNSEELPFLDGSAQQFCAQLGAVSKVSNDPSHMFDRIEFSLPFLYESGQARILVLPSTTPTITYIYRSQQPLLPFQLATWDGTDYIGQIAPARTFGFLDEVGPLLAAGLVRGASLENSVVFGRKHLLNNSLRFPDEPCRHKILDFVGDMAPLQALIHGCVFCVRTGHRTNAEFVGALYEALMRPDSGVRRLRHDGSQVFPNSNLD